MSFERSSNGKSKRVASIWVVSSIDTRSTQLNSSFRGRSSRILPTRSRITPSIWAMRSPPTPGMTGLRHWLWRGSSDEMKLPRRKFSGGSPMKMVGKDEKTCGLVSTSMMSCHLVIDQ